MNPKHHLLQALMMALISEPEKLVVSRYGERAMTVHTWKKDHSRLVGVGGETVYALRKIGEYMGIRLTLDEPVADIDAAVKPSPEFDPAETIRTLHKLANDPDAVVEADTEDDFTFIVVKGSILPPDFGRALTLVVKKIGTRKKRPIEVTYED